MVRISPKVRRICELGSPSDTGIDLGQFPLQISVGFFNSHAVQINGTEVFHLDTPLGTDGLADGILGSSPDIYDHLVTGPQPIICRSSQIHTRFKGEITVLEQIMTENLYAGSLRGGLAFKSLINNRFLVIQFGSLVGFSHSNRTLAHL